MFERHQPVGDELVLQGDYTLEGGKRATFLFAGRRERPTGVVAGNDEMAIGLIAGLRHRGFDCPRDMSVIGFDDISVSQNFAPPLTTMRQPREKIGRIDTETLDNIHEGNRANPEPVRVVLQSELIVRESTAPPSPA